MKATYFWQDYLGDLPYCNEVLSNYDAIKAEVLQFTSDPEALVDYPKYKVYDYWLYDSGWKAIPFSRYAGEFIDTEDGSDESRQIMSAINMTKSKCPVLSGITTPLEDQGHLRNAFISKLEPETIIRPHNGWTSDFLRIHLPIVVDPDCKITVGTHTHTWEEGKILSFIDGDMHSVKHLGTKDRIVVSVDMRINYAKQYVPELKEFGNSNYRPFG